MSQIKQLLILNRQGKGIKAIARTLGMSKNTVKAYLFKLDKLLLGNGTDTNPYIFHHRQNSFNPYCAGFGIGGIRIVIFL